MTDSDRTSDEPNIRAKLRDWLTAVLNSIDDAPEQQLRSLLGSLREWQRGERRRHPRRACSIPVKVGTWRVLAEHIQNISLGGVFIKTSAPFSLGEQLTLIFSVPNQNNPVRVTGNVVWTSSTGVGVQFTETLSKELKQIIDSL